MLKKLFLALIFTSVSLFAMNFQSASKEDLMSIKGIGEKKATAIIKYRKKNKIRGASDLENVPGIGKEIANNAKRGIKSGDKKSVKKSTSTKQKSNTKTKSTKEKTVKKASKAKSNTKKSDKKKAGDKTKRAEKKAKEKAKKKAEAKKNKN